MQTSVARIAVRLLAVLAVAGCTSDGDGEPQTEEFVVETTTEPSYIQVTPPPG